MRPYHFAILRYVPNAASEEFVNVGVVLLETREARLFFRIAERSARVSAFFKNFDRSVYRQAIRMLLGRLTELRDAQGQLHLLVERPKGLEQLLDSVVPPDESSFRWSLVMGGMAVEPEMRLDQLFAEFVERHESVGPRERRDEVVIWSNVERKLSEHDLLGRGVTRGVELTTRNFAYRFQAGWVNGTAQFIEPISLDYLAASDVLDKANTWSGRLLNLSRGNQFQFTGVVAPPAREDLLEPFNAAVRILREAPSVRTIILETEVDTFLPEIEQDIRTHRG